MYHAAQYCAAQHWSTLMAKSYTAITRPAIFCHHARCAALAIKKRDEKIPSRLLPHSLREKERERVLSLSLTHILFRFLFLQCRKIMQKNNHPFSWGWSPETEVTDECLTHWATETTLSETCCHLLFVPKWPQRRSSPNFFSFLIAISVHPAWYMAIRFSYQPRYCHHELYHELRWVCAVLLEPLLRTAHCEGPKTRSCGAVLYHCTTVLWYRTTIFGAALLTTICDKNLTEKQDSRLRRGSSSWGSSPLHEFHRTRILGSE
jgi:hypothetical protein